VVRGPPRSLGLACGTKEIAFVLPALVLLYELAFTPRVRAWVAAGPG